MTKQDFVMRKYACDFCHKKFTVDVMGPDKFQTSGIVRKIKCPYCNKKTKILLPKGRHYYRVLFGGRNADVKR